MGAWYKNALGDVVKSDLNQQTPHRACGVAAPEPYV
jgi:hypothetical protein